MTIPYADAHAHSNPVRGLGAAKVAERFRRAGGWFIALVGLSPWHYQIDVRRDPLAAYRKAVEVHIEECKRAREAGLRVACFAGFHPADVDHLLDAGLSHTKVLELGEAVVEHVARLCRDGVLDGIGEVGRQHFKTNVENALIAVEVLTRALEYARDYGCPVHMHLENAGEITVVLTDRLVERVGAPHEKLLFHHSKPVVASAAVERGYYATLPGKEPLLRYYFSRRMPLDRIMVESDYIDDPRRPCVSSCPWEVVERLEKLRREGVIDEETLARINVDNVVRFYGVEPP